MRWLPPLLRDLRFGRWLVISAGAIGIFFFLLRLVVDDRSLYRAFLEGAVAAFVTMVLVGTAERFWSRAKVEEVSAPGGWGVKFARATGRSVRIAVDGLLSQMDAVNARLLSLEEDVARLKGSASQTDPEE
jgi:hypothetical protein